MCWRSFRQEYINTTLRLPAVRPSEFLLAWEEEFFICPFLFGTFPLHLVLLHSRWSKFVFMSPCCGRIFLTTSLHSVLPPLSEEMDFIHSAPPPLQRFLPSTPLWSWNRSWRILHRAGCAVHEKKVFWRAPRPSSPSWCDKYSEDSGLDMAAEIQTLKYPTPPYCFSLRKAFCHVTSSRTAEPRTTKRRIWRRNAGKVQPREPSTAPGSLCCDWPYKRCP